MDESTKKFIPSKGKNERPEMLKINIDRPLYENDLLCQDYLYDKPEVSSLNKLANFCSSKKCSRQLITQTVPALKWLKNYKWKEDIFSDIISGITVAIMHIPQGMAYGLLGNVPPIIGIYMAFFPVLIYVLFGTSKHVSMGTFAVACLMTGKIVKTYSNLHVTNNDGSEINNSSNIDIPILDDKFEDIPTPIEVATAVTFMVGIIQLVMYIFRLGVISSLLSEPFVNGFTTAAAVHVLVSQISNLLGLKSSKPGDGDFSGLKSSKQRGYFKCIRTLIDVFSKITNTNVTASIVSATTILIMILGNEFLKPWLSKKCSFPVPVELLAVVIGTLISNTFNLSENYLIETVGDIPTGLPAPSLPRLSLLENIILDSIAITMVCYTITMSMSLIFAQKDGYNIDSNQELFAMGCSNIFGAFFSCMPISASLSRSLIQHSVGGRTQFASIVSCVLLLFILLWIGPFFEPLPRCVLASVIVVALKGMLLQAKEFVRFWKLSKYDATVWILTFLSTVLINIDIGLLTGLIASVTSILLQSVTPYSCLLGQASNTDLFLDMKRFKGVFEPKGMKIFHYAGSINFINERSLKSTLCREVDIQPEKVLKYRLKLAKRGLSVEDISLPLRCIIIDMSSVSFVDPSGVAALRTVVSDFAKVDILVYLAACSTPVFETIKTCDLYKKNELNLQIFATLLDAVHFCQKECTLNEK